VVEQEADPELRALANDGIGARIQAVYTGLESLIEATLISLNVKIPVAEKNEPEWLDAPPSSHRKKLPTPKPSPTLKNRRKKFTNFNVHLHFLKLLRLSRFKRRADIFARKGQAIQQNACSGRSEKIFNPCLHYRAGYCVYLLMKTLASVSSISWLTDLHLNKASHESRNRLYALMAKSSEEAFIITGDISESAELPLHLREISAAAGTKPVFFVLGNHDFYKSSFERVDRIVAGVCNACPNLKHLGAGERIRLNEQTTLIGHRGWCDGRMGWQERSWVRNPDFAAIDDFRGMRRPEAFGLMRRLGQESARYFRNLLPLALTNSHQVIIATHFPPFTKAACFNAKPCDYARQPFFSNISAGAVILRISERFPSKRVTVLCGHSHGKSRLRMTSNLEVLTGGARIGYPAIQGRIDLITER
jgi:predicted phosphohydrolase